jgi:hypothetical protein
MGLGAQRGTTLLPVVLLYDEAYDELRWWGEVHLLRSAGVKPEGNLAL